MSVVEDEKKCKQRFKGVENFLRRVAFNLGNTPSQTEVKIISCIPIDVTDLQQKIIQLEKQLEDAKTVKETPKETVKDTGQTDKDAGKVASKDVKKDAGKDASKDATKNGPKDNVKPNTIAVKTPKPSEVSNTTPKQASAVHTALYSSHFPRFTKSKAVECSQSSQAIQCDDVLSNRKKKSTVSFLLSTAPSNKAIGGCLTSDKSNLSSEERSHTVLNELRKKFLKKKKKATKRHKVETHLVYYARTDNTRYNSRSVIRDFTPTETTIKARELIDQPCLSNMIRKQYQPATVIDELSDSSQVSSPICRDEDPCRKSRLYESDICSCCHETFHNVDNYIFNNPVNEFNGFDYNISNNSNTYYDSSLYDLVPVKEKAVRNRKDVDIPKRKENKIDIKCWPESVRAKARCPPIVVNYHTVTPARPEYTKKLYTKAVKKDIVGEVTITQDKRVPKLDQHTAMESSKSCCVDLGELYPKPAQKAKPVILAEPIPPCKNAECFTDAVSAVDCQTITPKLDDKTEMTLNQIKTILQSVLTEVKTNSQLKHNVNKPKKDAIIQKGTSQSNLLDGSSFLNSFTYSPYNMNPYVPSCSKQMPSNCFCHPGLPNSMRCMQNYPLFIHTPGRQMCTSCYRSSPYKACPKNTTAGTNTEEQEKRGKETQKLIKEIYKSVALGVPGQDTSHSEYDDLKTARTPSNKSKEVQLKDTKHLISEIFRNTDMQVNTSDTLNTNTTIYYRNKDESTRSHSETTDPGGDRHNKNKKVEDTQPSTETEPDVVRNRHPRRVVQPIKRIETISESTDSESSSSETVSDVTTVSVKKPEKKRSGLFSKVCNLFNRNKKKKDTKVEAEADSASSDSDYQTVYSQKINPPKRTEHRAQRSRAHSKLHSRRSHQTQRSPERPKRTPYMEQEYRRLWNEKLMFQNTKPRYSSERPATRETTPGVRQKPIYYQNYETRSVLVDPRKYHPRYDVINRKPCLADMNNQKRPYSQNYQHEGAVGVGREPVRPPNNIVKRNAVVRDTMAAKKGVNMRPMTKGLTWLKSHKPRCGEQWKKFIIEG